MVAPVAPATPGPAPAPDEKAKLQALLAEVERVRGGTRAIVYWMGPMARISEAVVLPLYDQLRALGKQQALDLVLFTAGGDTEAPARIVSLLREYCDRFSLLLPHRAHSSGTLIALGADEIVMTPLSILGPIDPTRTHPLLPKREGAQEAEPISVQDMRHAMQFIREAGGTAGAQATYTPESMAMIFSALFEKIHPLAIGAIEQSYALAKLVAQRCLETHMDAVADAGQITAIVDRLCDGYKSHAYEIGRKEAASIGLKVTDAPSDSRSHLTN